MRKEEPFQLSESEIGKRLFLTGAEISRIQREGLPPLR